MNKQNVIFLILMFFGLNGFSQIIFKQGSFIDENNQRIECFIKDMDWLNNPSGFEYKLSDEPEIKKGDIHQVKEFEINNTSKYVRALVQIDRSGSEIKDLSSSSNPDFEEELLFLKVLVEGKASLYQYRETNLTRFFYKMDDQEIKQLVFKYFLVRKSQVARNEFFKQQLFSDLECHELGKKDFEQIKYNFKDLAKLFVIYNECIDFDYVNFSAKKGNDRFLLNIRPGVNINNLSIASASDFLYGQNKFPTRSNFRLAVELEYMLPFNANKWSVIFEPTYRNQNWEDTWETRMVAGGIVIAHVDYQSVELPLGIRYYHHLGRNSKVFANISYLKDFTFNSSFDQIRTTGDPYNSRPLKTTGNLAFGVGSKYNDRFIAEIRYHTGRHILNTYGNWDSDFRALSVIFGYTLF